MEQGTTANGFARIICNYVTALKDADQGDIVGVREEKTSAIRPDVGGLGDTKECFAFINEAAAGTIYLTLVNLAGGAKIAE